MGPSTAEACRPEPPHGEATRGAASQLERCLSTVAICWSNRNIEPLLLFIGLYGNIETKSVSIKRSLNTHVR